MISMPQGIRDRLKEIRFFAFDFDGIMTDGYVYVDQNGVESVRCSRKDGLGIEMLKKSNIIVCVISKEVNRVVSERCKKLGIDCWQGVEHGEGKKDIFLRLLNKYSIDHNQAAYMGDDINDIPSLKSAGLAFTVSDAHEEVKKVAHIITNSHGGNHAVREICNYIINAKAGISIE